MRAPFLMCTTLEIDDDLLAAARSLAAQRKASLGKVVSDLLRQAFSSPTKARKSRNGVLIFEPTDDPRIPSLELFNRLRDEVP